MVGRDLMVLGVWMLEVGALLYGLAIIMVFRQSSHLKPTDAVELRFHKVLNTSTRIGGIGIFLMLVGRVLPQGWIAFDSMMITHTMSRVWKESFYILIIGQSLLVLSVYIWTKFVNRGFKWSYKYEGDYDENESLAAILNFFSPILATGFGLSHLEFMVQGFLSPLWILKSLL